MPPRARARAARVAPVAPVTPEAASTTRATRATPATPATTGNRAPREAPLGPLCPVTLVLGAGVSMARGVPSWPTLVERVWREAGLGEVPTFVARSWETPPPHPLAFQIVLELAAERLARRRKAATLAEGRAALAELLRGELYRTLKRPPASTEDTLATLARHVIADQARDARAITRIITFNADDLLEQEAGASLSSPVVWPIARASAHPRHGRGAGGRPPISLYHLHGFLPRRRPGRGDATLRYADAPDTLVFTDAQYWASVASPMSFANRVMQNALFDSHCVFIGLSMTDVNLARWLGLRHGEVQGDKESELGALSAPPERRDAARRRALGRHVWVRKRGGPGEELISSWLALRGVRTAELDDWGEPFKAWLDETLVTRTHGTPTKART